MKIRGLTFEELEKKLVLVYERLSAKKACRKLLDAALDDSPAIRRLHEMMSEVHFARTDSKQAKKRQRRMMLRMKSDFVLLLALRELDLESEESGEGEVVRLRDVRRN